MLYSVLEVHKRGPCKDEAIQRRVVSRLYRCVIFPLQIREDFFVHQLTLSAELVLSVPKQFVDVGQFLLSLQMALKLGLGHNPTAIIGLNAIDYWRKVKKDELQKYLPEILPCLNNYLLIQHEDKGVIEIDNDDEDKNLEALRDRKEKSIHHDVQLRIVRLLAKFGGDNIHILKVYFFFCT